MAGVLYWTPDAWKPPDAAGLAYDILHEFALASDFALT